MPHQKTSETIQPHFMKAPQLNDDISVHSAYLYKTIYSKPYPGYNKSEIARYYHGIQHTNRAAIYSVVFINLFRKYKNQEALELTQEEIKLIQIAALLHDSARQGDGVDLWDNESGELLYDYLIAIGVTPKQAHQMAEAMANKDAEAKYYRLDINENTKIKSWKLIAPAPKKNIYQKIIHDADCLDIIRARDHFDANYLDFYKEVASQIPDAFEEMARLIVEARSLITLQGDHPQCQDSEIKTQHECEAGYQTTLDELQNNQKQYAMIRALYTPHCFAEMTDIDADYSQTLTTDQSEQERRLDESFVQSKLVEGRVFSRGIFTPSYMTPKHYISLIEQETYKANRRNNQPTRSRFNYSLSKHGNPNRSISLLGYGSSAFASAGFLLINPDIGTMRDFSSSDTDTGFGRKATAKATNCLSSHQALLKKLKMGGGSRRFPIHSDSAATHTEILCNVTHYDAIYFTNEPAFATTYTHANTKVVHPFSPLLQAYFIQQEYEKLYNITLPIFEYSALHNSIQRLSPEKYKEENIVKMWKAMCAAYIKKENRFYNPTYENIEKIKINAMYGSKTISRFFRFSEASADRNYPIKLQDKINAVIAQICLEPMTYIHEFMNDLILLSSQYRLQYVQKNIFLVFNGYILGNVAKLLPLENRLEFIESQLNVVRNISELRYILNELTHEEALYIVKNCHTHICGREELLSLMDFIHPSQRIQLADYLLKLDTAKVNLADVTHFLAPEDRLDFAEKNKSKIENTKILLDVLNLLPIRKKRNFVQNIPIKSDILFSTIGILSQLPEDEQADYAKAHLASEITPSLTLSTLFWQIRNEKRNLMYYLRSTSTNIPSLTLNIVSAFSNQIQTIDDLLKLLAQTPKKINLKIINMLIDRMQPNTFNIRQLATLLSLLEPNETYQFIKDTGTANCIETSSDLELVLKLVPDSNQLDFVKELKIKSMIRRIEQLRVLKNELNHAVFAYITDQVDRTSLIKSIHDLQYVLELLPQDKRLNWIETSSMDGFVKSTDEIMKIQSLLPPKDRATFIQKRLQQQLSDSNLSSTSRITIRELKFNLLELPQYQRILFANHVANYRLVDNPIGLIILLGYIPSQQRLQFIQQSNTSICINTINYLITVLNMLPHNDKVRLFQEIGANKLVTGEDPIQKYAVHYLLQKDPNYENCKDIDVKHEKLILAQSDRRLIENALNRIIHDGFNLADELIKISNKGNITKLSVAQYHIDKIKNPNQFLSVLEKLSTKDRHTFYNQNRILLQIDETDLLLYQTQKLYDLTHIHPNKNQPIFFQQNSNDATPQVKISNNTNQNQPTVFQQNNKDATPPVKIPNNTNQNQPTVFQQNNKDATPPVKIPNNTNQNQPTIFQQNSKEATPQVKTPTNASKNKRCTLL